MNATLARERASAERFCPVGREVTLCYETFGDAGAPPVLLVMGLSTQMLGWREEFCAQLADRGFYVVRFDNRDSGRSTHMDTPPPSTAQLIHRRFGSEQYDLGDMADDAAGLLSALDLAPAHVIGASMGGMIAQTLGARHPAAVRSLVSVMSTTGAVLKGQPAVRAMPLLLRRAPRDRESYIEHVVGVFDLIGSPGFPQDTDDIRDVAARSFDRGYDPDASGRQLAAVLATGNRTSELRRIQAPTLVVHGTEDPMVARSGGRATARAIPRAELMLVEGMGHDMPRALWPKLLDAFEAHMRWADELQAAAA